MSSVCCLIPARDEVKTEFMLSFVAMMQHCALHPPDGLTGLGFEVMRTSILPSGRQSLANAAITLGVSHTLWLDSDMGFPKDTLHRLLAHDLDVVGVNARERRPPYRFVVEETPMQRLVTDKTTKGVVEVHRMGLAVALVKTSVFHRLDWPFFDFEVLPEKQTFRGEDYYFCEKARKAGVKFHVDHDLSREVAHIGDFAFMP